MAPLSRELATLLEDLGLVAITYVGGWLTTSCKFSSRRPNIFLTSVGTCMYMACTDTQTYQLNIKKTIK